MIARRLARFPIHPREFPLQLGSDRNTWSNFVLIPHRSTRSFAGMHGAVFTLMRVELPTSPAICALRTVASLAVWQTIHVTRVTLAALLGL
jgi:hypothetical protein